MSVELKLKNSSVNILLHGATAVSWKADGIEQLFLSSKAITDGSKAVRGGIPIVFPQFATGPQSPKVQHGFARVSKWNKLSQVESDHEVSAVFQLISNESTMQAWPHKFEVLYTVTLTEDKLKTSLRVINPLSSGKNFSFTSLLHSYFAIDDIDAAYVSGLDGVSYKDKVSGKTEKQTGDISVSSEVDRVYVGGAKEVVINGKLKVTPFGFADCVVWNPWLEKAIKMADFDDDEYTKMICVEMGTVDAEVTLQPGQEWTAGQIFAKL